jgi:hypothetical protein
MLSGFAFFVNILPRGHNFGQFDSISDINGPFGMRNAPPACRTHCGKYPEASRCAVLPILSLICLPCSHILFDQIEPAINSFLMSVWAFLISLCSRLAKNLEFGIWNPEFGIFNLNTEPPTPAPEPKERLVREA